MNKIQVNAHMTKHKQSKPIDLREYEEEAIPFDQVIKRLAHVKTPAL